MEYKGECNGNAQQSMANSTVEIVSSSSSPSVVCEILKEAETVSTRLNNEAMVTANDTAGDSNYLANGCRKCLSRYTHLDVAVCDCNSGSKNNVEKCTVSSSSALTEIDVSSQGLSAISDSLIQLTRASSATKLDLAYNSLSEVPESIFDHLSMVCILSLAGNDLQELPMAISHLRHLCEINISNNQLRSLPSSIVQLSQLQTINFSSNAIECLPYEFGRLTSLERIEGYENQLKTLPDTFGLLKRLHVLELGENFIGSLPRNFGYLRSLETLNLAGNKLEHLPESFSSLDSILFLDLSGNGLNCLPPRFRSCRKIQRLFVEKNRLASLPDWFNDMPELQELGLKDNHLAESPLPSSFGCVCKQLKVLELGGNYIKHLPESLGELKLLERFHIGSVIDELERANFQNGNWIWKLPNNFGLLASLSYANLNENQLTELPENFGDLVNLKWIDLGQNRLNELPESFGNLRSLVYCQLSRNHLELLPANFGNLTQLEELRLDNNKIAELPMSFCQLTQLKTLDLFSNRLTEIPPYLSTFTKLTRYDLGENKFGIHHLLVPQMVRPNKYAERDQALKDNWRGRKRADHVEMEVAKVVEPDATYDLSKEEPEEELQFNSSLLEHVARRNMSLWRSHGMSAERPVYAQPEDETDDSSGGDDSEVQEESKSNKDDEIDDWFTEDKLSLQASSPGSDGHRSSTAIGPQSAHENSAIVEEDWDADTIEVTTSSPYDLDDTVPSGTGNRKAYPVMYHSPFFFLPASWHAQSVIKKAKTVHGSAADFNGFVDPFQFDDVQ